MSSIETVKIQNFRNHDNIDMSFMPGINVIWGENGSGKTAVLEAIYILAMGRSFRTRNQKETLKENAEKLSVNGRFKTKSELKEIILNQLSTGQRKFFINEIPLARTSELVGQHPVVLLSPEEQSITKGPPADRRKYFDKIFSTISKKYLDTLVMYQRAIKQRNTALQETRKNHSSVTEVEAWNETLIKHGTDLWRTKKKLFTDFSKELSEINNKNKNSNTIVEVKFIPEGDTETFEKRLEKSLNLDLIKGWTTTGPHRDNYRILFNNRSLKKFGSQGEHKLSLVLIKMAEINTIKKDTGNPPILMLDDFFAKLDFQRADNMLTLLNGTYQTIITTTDIVDVEKHGINLKSDQNTTYQLKRQCKA